MRVSIFFAAFTILAAATTGCKSSSADAPATFCDTACLTDTIRYTGDHKLAPFIYISTKNCKPENIIRGHKAMGSVLNTGFGFENVNFNKDYIRIIADDTAAAYILFNDCLTGRGYQVKLPYNKTGTINKRSSGINSLDKKFAVAPNMIAYTDRGNIYVEETKTGKKAMMTFGQGLDIDYDAIHDHIDSVNVTADRIWVKVLIEKKWTELEKKISLE